MIPRVPVPAAVAAPMAPVRPAVAPAVAVASVAPAVAPAVAVPVAKASSGPAPPQLARALFEDDPTCVICMDLKRPDQDIYAQWCGHTFHKYCLEEWRHCARKSLRACPMRCEYQPIAAASFEAQQQSLGLSTSFDGSAGH